MPAAQIDDGVVTRGSRAIVDGLNLRVPAGEVTAVLGPNGAGKSTTVAVLAGLTDLQSGSAIVLGGTPGRLVARQRVGVMLQRDALPTGARGVEVVRHVARLRGAGSASADELIGLLGIAAFGRTPVRRLSGGERRRVSLACALVGQPDLVILDEPTAGLDPQGRQIVAELVVDLRSRGTAVLLSTHLLDEAELLGDHLAVMFRGRCVLEGSLAELTSSSGERITFEAAAHLDVGTLAQALPRTCVVSETRPGHYRVEGSADPLVLASVSSWCAQHGVAPRNLHAGTESLEDLYWRLSSEHDA